jgi:hypothetical protein
MDWMDGVLVYSVKNELTCTLSSIGDAVVGELLF